MWRQYKLCHGVLDLGDAAAERMEAAIMGGFSLKFAKTPCGINFTLIRYIKKPVN